MTEAYPPNRDAGRLGTVRTDITFTSQTTGRRLFLNTTETKTDGTAPTRREYEAAVRVILNGEAGDSLVLVAKPPRGHSLDLEVLKEFLRPLLRELNKPAPEIDPRHTTAPETLWHEWFPARRPKN